ncbi:MAG: hypothetical protein F6K18_29060 [Okeania sp. SIO2C2]|uniref:hypothetical protein n=1 Tax=Okeania sp. SIO2C2 TaxID=2607787 RepID=UPI0013B75631|nr:hypothetical protein [Okeania sp. SIO2C2]NEP90540.1 hypothetical protein [Okeania sp. SIO2C2]
MAFSDYKTIAQVQEEYKIKYLEADFIEITDLKPSDLFVKELKFSEQNMDIYTSLDKIFGTISFLLSSK